jgi:hypothetical protein
MIHSFIHGVPNGSQCATASQASQAMETDVTAAVQQSTFLATSSNIIMGTKKAAERGR